MERSTLKPKRTPVLSKMGMPLDFQSNGVLKVSGFPLIYSSCWSKEEDEGGGGGSVNSEPTSVPDKIRSPSPPTSTSTLCSSLGGGGNGGGSGGGWDNTTALAAVSVNSHNNKVCQNPLLQDSGGGVGLIEDSSALFGGRKEGWDAELHRIPIGFEDWGSMSPPDTAAIPAQEPPLFQLIAGDVDFDATLNPKQLLEFNGSLVNQNVGFEEPILEPCLGNLVMNGNSCLGFNGSGVGQMNPSKDFSGLVDLKGIGQGTFNNFNLQVSLPQGGIHQQQVIATPQQITLNHQNMNFSPTMLNAPEEFVQAQPKRHQPGPSSMNPVQFGWGLTQQMQAFPQPQFQQKPELNQKVVDVSEGMSHTQNQIQRHDPINQLLKALQLVENGNFSHAHEILARLNLQLSPVGKPLHRAAFYIKEALRLLLLSNNPVTSPSRSLSPLDVVCKMGAYKVFSEVSPVLQFANFTRNQAILEATGDASRIHIIDFDIGFGAQWASFLQELPMRNSRGSPSLKITAFSSLSSHHPIELTLMRDNLVQFAHDIGVDFQLEVVNFDSLDPILLQMPVCGPSGAEAVVVNFPTWSSSNCPSAIPVMLQFIKQLSPKIVVSLDNGFDRNDLPFSLHILHALQAYETLLDSLDAANVSPDVANKMERLLLQPRIECTILGRWDAPAKLPPWKKLFSLAGFSPLMFSNFSESQAECILKRTPIRGFHIEKKQASLVLCWQHRELVSVSAWRC
ncbi:Transcription factor GRAS [Dillenia turbinata]|uniref:Transcription factor GRAS n=1 Tax=Dillenia turbinata TaxID=194707 RepID=A0AAN8VJF9_9MAGN